ncbi:nucleotidyltransferase family protein [Holdemanella porci]
MKTCGIIAEYNPFHQGHIGSLTPLFTTDLKHSA